MRPIRFRAWDKKRGVMISSKRNLLTFDGQIMPDGRAEYRREDYVVMQFTGLVDKTGEEIFEGDIVITAYNDKCKIVFGEFVDAGWRGIGFFFETLDGKHHEYLASPAPNNSYEVIGDIYSTPELLEAK